MSPKSFELPSAEKPVTTGDLEGCLPLRKRLATLGLIFVIGTAAVACLGLGTFVVGGKEAYIKNVEIVQSLLPVSINNAPLLTARASIWQPAAGASWQIVLPGAIKISKSGASSLKPDVGIYDLDLYENDKATFTALHNAGKKVICYFSAGSWEDWREDKDEFPAKDLGKTLDGWPDEKWLNIKSTAVRKIMKKRIKLAADKGCDAIDPDNVDGYQNDNGLGLKKADSISYVKFLSAEAAKYGMATGLKNAGDIVSSVLSHVQFSVNEQCIEYSECETFAPFIKAGKPVFHIEYPDGAPKVKESDRKTICSHTGKAKGTDGFSTVIKKMNLDGWVMYCSKKTYTTPMQS